MGKPQRMVRFRRLRGSWKSWARNVVRMTLLIMDWMSLTAASSAGVKWLLDTGRGRELVFVKVTFGD
jgi:hypothetical protein